MNSMDRDREAILALLDSYHEAMVAAQVNELGRILAPDFCLVHMTGYVQPKGEWLTVVSKGDFNYHAIEVDQSSLAVEINLHSAELTGHGIFDATINRMHHPWRMQFCITLVRQENQWEFTRARYVSC